MREALERVLNALDTTGCVVTSVDAAGRPAGCFATYLAPCSMEPPRLMVFTSVENLTHEAVERSGVIAVHPLVRGQELWVADFGFRSGRDTDKFAGVAWRRGETGAPILDEAPLWVEGRVIASVPCGDHVGRLVEPVAAAAADAPEPLTFRELLARDLYRPDGAGWRGRPPA